MEYMIMYIFSLLQIGTDRRKKITINTTIFLVILILFSALRKGIGTDYETYMSIYEMLPLSIEPGYLLINFICNKLNMGLSVVFLISSIIMFTNMIIAFKKFKVDIGISMFLYFCLYFLTHHFNIVRHGIAASFVFLALAFVKDEKIKSGIIAVLIGSMFHIIALLFLPILFISKIRLSKKIYFLIIIISFILMSIDIVGYFAHYINVLIPNSVFAYKINYYIQDYYLNIGVDGGIYGFTLGFFARLIIFIFVLTRNKFYNNRFYEINILFIGLIFMIIFNKYGVFAERIVNILYMIEIILLADFKKIFSKDRFTQMILIITLISYGSLLGSKILISKENNGNYQYIPYESIIYSRYNN